MAWLLWWRECPNNAANPAPRQISERQKAGHRPRSAHLPNRSRCIQVALHKDLPPLPALRAFEAVARTEVDLGEHQSGLIAFTLDD